MIKSLLVVVLSVSVIGCSSIKSYDDGPLPNFILTGGEAQEEYKKFALESGNVFHCGRICFQSDPKKAEYSVSSMMPLIESVSPQATTTIKKAQSLEKYQKYALGIGVAGILGALLVDDDSMRSALLVGSVAGSVSSVAIGFYASSTYSKVPEIYNRDLRNRLIPTIGMNWSF